MSPLTANGSTDDADAPIVIGVLALQGAFREHTAHLNRLPGVSSVEVRNKEHLANLDGLIIPGGILLLPVFMRSTGLLIQQHILVSRPSQPQGLIPQFTAPETLAAGESTTMANIAQRWGLIPELKNFAEQGRPMWGTCAGLIFLADRASGEHMQFSTMP